MEEKEKEKEKRADRVHKVRYTTTRYIHNIHKSLPYKVRIRIK
jgi:hypothetical protein